ncbi:MAG: GntR family transcriptional regulator [Clostridiales bacterium]|nr:GntR family transcriptional regulator [Clostridiales bacterium]
MKIGPNIPKGEMVKRYVRHLLKDDIITYGEKLPSEHDLMEKFQVSRQTVRQAFGELTVEGLIYKEQGKGTFSNYRKGAKGSQIVAVVTTYLSGFVFPGIISGIEQILSDEGYMMLLSNTNNIKEREAQYLKSVLEHNVVGMIIEPTSSSGPNINNRLLSVIREKGIKTVFINACYDDFDSAYVLLDDIKGGHTATDYLLQLGHTRIAGIFKTDDKQGVNRMQGYTDALRAYESAGSQTMVGEYDTANMYDYPYMFAQSLLRGKERPTAFFCYNDQCALMVLQAIHDQGLKVPEDISVVGYDDSISPMNSEVKLTTIRHPKQAMGGQAARFMVDMLEGRAEKPQYIHEPELIVRKSCRKI